MECSFCHLGIHSHKWTIDLSTLANLMFQKWRVIKDPLPSYVLGAQEIIPSLRNYTTSATSWSLFCGLWNYQRTLKQLVLTNCLTPLVSPRPNGTSLASITCQDCQVVVASTFLVY
jgi:hypothetical protein